MPYSAVWDATSRVVRDEPLPSALARAVLTELPDADFVATQHPLGFLHLALEGAPDEPAARVHIWNAGALASADPLGKLHDHTWELHSAVLVGGVVDTALDAVPNDHGGYVAQRVRYGRDRNSLEPVAGRWELRERGRRRVGAGQGYALPARVIHATEVLARPTATLVVPVERGGPGPMIFTPVGAAMGEAAVRKPVTAERVRAALAEALAALDLPT